MMPSFLNNFFYGKAGQADYTPERMPKTRVALFFEMLRIHFSGLMGTNLLYLLFCLPALIWTMYNAPILISGEVEISADMLLNGLIPWYLMILIPCLVIAGVGAPGLMYVLRNWARDQHSFTFSDFRDNVKANWKNGALAGLVNGLSLYVGYIAVRFYSSMTAQSAFYIVPQMMVILVCGLWWMINMLIYPMMVTYDMKFRQLVRNSLLIALGRLPFSFVFLIGSLLPAVLLLLLPSGYALIALVLLYLLIGFALTGFVYASYANSCFDKYLNPRIEGAPVNMGLRDPSLDDDDDDVEDGQPTA